MSSGFASKKDFERTGHLMGPSKQDGGPVRSEGLARPQRGYSERLIFESRNRKKKDTQGKQAEPSPAPSATTPRGPRQAKKEEEQLVKAAAGADDFFLMGLLHDAEVRRAPRCTSSPPIRHSCFA
jgi:hypothetical protein